ncbi:MAG: heme-copper oxidase subunit III [Myxococcaceae bacterium]|jgi:cytochrome c oxidase subunit 3/cytochrome o ubiquinol oxidase subunit 3|nr:MAG: heme-copper oxidase subunit III [Myxococcaceae bacterium]
MFSLIAAEVSIFVIFIVAYLFYLGKSVTGPTPAILHPPIFLSVCLLSSSATMELAVRGLKRTGARGFIGWWLLTFALGATFLAGTGLEWRHLIQDEGLTISTNLFGTTFYSLVGLHGFHVLIGLVLMLLTAGFTARGLVARESAPKVEVLALYWHFVDVVWVVVFTVVYLVGR